MLSFETIGNATLIVHDDKPLLATDPWLDGSCYFGSWALPYEVPESQLKSVLECPYIWLSHGHPDHIHIESLNLLRNSKILIPDHYGSRVYGDLVAAGFDVITLASGDLFKLSDRVSIFSFADYHQDAALVVKIGDTVVANLNDCSVEGFYWSRQVRNLLKKGRPSFLLKKTTYRDADMTNFFDDEGKRIEPDVRPEYIALILNYWCNLLKPDYFIPFSHFHYFQRNDSKWANKFVETDLSFEGELSPKRTTILPAFIRYETNGDNIEPLYPPHREVKFQDPKEFGDNWEDDLTASDKSDIENYFKRAELIHNDINFITVRSGKSEITVTLKKEHFRRGLVIETPRNSFCDAIRHEVFDDILIGNFAKFHLVGNWNGAETFPYLQPTLPRFVDNGRAYTQSDFAAYKEYYRKISPRDFVIHQIQRSLQMKVRPILENHPRLFSVSSTLLSKIRSRI